MLGDPPRVHQGRDRNVEHSYLILKVGLQLFQCGRQSVGSQLAGHEEVIRHFRISFTSNNFLRDFSWYLITLERMPIESGLPGSFLYPNGDQAEVCPFVLGHHL